MGDGKETREIILARWSDRFLAWLIDFIIVQVIGHLYMTR
jgi:hypothetical protein